MSREGKDALSTTGLQRLLRRIIPDSDYDSKTTYRELMDASERRLAATASSDNPVEKLLTARILHCPQEYQRWEEEHSILMQRVAEQRGEPAQKTSLLATALALIHRKALFEHLRDQHVCGNDRERLLKHFRTGEDYASLFIQEHATYLRSTASFICVRSVGRRIIRDSAFAEPLTDYEEAYAEYFGVFCKAALENADEEGSHSSSLLIPLKQRVNELRAELLGPSVARSGNWRKLSAVPAP
jgi:hypothetical protein